MPMPFDLDSAYLIYFLAAASAVLFVEAVYLLCFSTASYRSRINRRLRLLKDRPTGKACWFSCAANAGSRPAASMGCRSCRSTGSSCSRG